MSTCNSKFTKNEDKKSGGKILMFDAITSSELTDELVIESIIDFLNSPTTYWTDEEHDGPRWMLIWLMEAYSKHEEAECYILKAITKIIKYFPEYRMFVLIELFLPESLIYARSDFDIVLKGEGLVQSILDCIDAIFIDSDCLTLSEDKIMSRKGILKLLCRMHYWKKFNIADFPSIIFHSLILLKKLLSLCKEDIPLYVSDLLGICTTYMFLGNSVKEGNDMRPQKVLPLSPYTTNFSDDLEPFDPNNLGKMYGKFLKLKKTRSANIGIQCEVLEKCRSSDMAEDNVKRASSNSDVEQNHNKNEIVCNIRMASIDLLGYVVRCVQQRVLHSYWHSLYPCNPDGRSDILLVSETDENSDCRCAALQVCTWLFLNSKSLFKLAEYRYRSAAFIPFSQKLGLTILSASKSLMITITKEKSVHVLIQALKCTTALLQVSDFTKFQCRWIYSLLDVIKKLVSHNDWTVQVSALTVLECVLTDSKTPFAVGAVLSSDQVYNVCDINISENKMNEKFIWNWLLLKTLYNLGHLKEKLGARNVQIPNPLRIKSFQLLSAMALHFEIFKDYLDNVAIAIEEALKDSQFEIRLCGSKCLDAVVYQMSTILQSDNSIIDKCVSFWVRILPIVMLNIQLEQELSPVKIALVDSISNISGIVFENLPQSIRISLLSFLTGFCSETTADVVIRANIVRVLSIFLTFPSMRINLVFIENTADLLLRLSGVNNVSVRIKIIWSMGNISDVLLDNTLESSNERISDETLWSLIKQAIEACNDNDKVRCNAVRTIGNLMRLLSERHFVKAADRILIKLAISKLIDGVRSSGTSKVKWNSCYAVGNVIQNEIIFSSMEMYKDVSWQSALYSSLCNAICSNSNYKVKINATTAILHINKAKYIAEQCGVIWKTIIRAIELSNNLENFYEYNHRNLLQEQLCLLLCHIINLAAPDDYVLFSRILLERIEVVRSTWISVTRRMIPEKSAVLLACSSHLYDESNSIILNSEQKSSIKLLLDAIAFNY